MNKSLSTLVNTDGLHEPQMTIGYGLFERMTIKISELQDKLSKDSDEAEKERSIAMNLFINLFLSKILSRTQQDNILDTIHRCVIQLNSSENCPYSYTVDLQRLYEYIQNPLSISLSEGPLVNFDVRIKDNFTS